MLIKLFLSENKEDQIKFQEQFEQIISEVPNKVANQESFWIYFFLGPILMLPNTTLASELKIKKIEAKISDDQKAIDLRIIVEDKIICRSVKAETTTVPVVEHESNSLSGNFIEIGKILKQNFTLGFNRKTEEGFVKGLFRNLSKIYKHYRNREFQLKQKPEALHQAFIYGFFKMNTEYNCFIEFNAGFGTADLVLQVNYFSIIAECKVGNKTVQDAVQQIKNKGYYHLSILDEFKVAFLVGVNFNQEKDQDLVVEEKKIFKFNGLINTLMKKNIAEEELQENVRKELKHLCYTKNIGTSNPDNPSNHNEADPKNKCVGSFTVLTLGQILQYCGQNNERKLECVTTQLEEGSKAQNTELVITDSDNKLKLNIIEFIDKGGNESPTLPTADEDISSPEPEDDSCGNYNIKVCINRNDEEFLYKIIFSDGQVTVDVDKEKEHSNSVTRARSVREVKSTKDPDYVYSSSSSQESKASSKKSMLERKKVNIARLISEMDDAKQDYLREIIISYRDFIHSEANLQLFLKGLFMNAEINKDEQIVAETEVSSGQAGEIDLLMKLPNGQGMVFECKFCEKVEEVEDSKKDAWSQLESYTDKGNLKYIFEKSSQLYTLAIIFCKESAMCNIEVKATENDQCDKIIEVNQDSSIDSGFASSEEFFNANISLDLSTHTHLLLRVLFCYL